MKANRKLPFEKILDWLEGRLPEEKARAVAAEVATASEETRGEVAWLRAFLKASRETRLAAPPAEVREALRRGFEEFAKRRKPPYFFQHLRANLTFDSQAQLAVAGYRSAMAEGTQRQLVYATETAEIALNIQPRPQEQGLNLLGQVFPKGEARPKAFVIQLLHGSDEIGLTSADELGEFSFEAVPEGSYELILSTDQFEILLSPIPVKA